MSSGPTLVAPAPLPFPQPIAKAPMFPLLTFDDLAALPPPEWLVEGICEVDSQVMLYGPSGGAKSFVGLDVALSVASGKPWHGHKVKQGPVVYVAGEGGKGISRRIAAWCELNDCPAPPEAFFLLKAPQLIDAAHLAALVADIRRCTPELVLIVLDTFARTFVGGEENSAKDTGVWIAAAAALQSAFRATVLTVHHSGKKKGKQAPPDRGSSALRGAMDTVVQVSKSGMAITVSCEKQKDDEEFEKIGLTLTQVDLGDGVTSCALTDGIVDGLGNRGLTANNWRLLNVLAGCGPGPIPVAEWREAVDEDEETVAPRTFDRWREECQPTISRATGKGFGS